MTALESRLGTPDPLRMGLLWLDSDLPPDPEVFHRAAQAAVVRMDLALAHRFAEAAVAVSAGVEAQILLAYTLSVASKGKQADQVLAALADRALPDEVSAAVVHLRAANLLRSMGSRSSPGRSSRTP